MSQKKTAVTKANNKAIQKETDYDALEKLVKSTVHSANPKKLLQDLDKAFKTHDSAKTKESKEETRITLNKAYNNAVYAHSLDNHVAICNTVDKNYHGLVVNMTNQLISDFDCRAPHEKALAELIASSYARYIDYSALFANIRNIEYLSDVKTRFYSLYSKESDKAYRQFNTALSTLKQLKSPTPSINVIAKNAFVAQNQQLNAEKSNERKEIINA